MTRIIRDLISGFVIPLNGLAVIFGAPKKIFLSILPFFIGLGMLVLGLTWAYSSLGGLVEVFLAKFLASGSAWFSILSPVLAFLTWAGFITLGFLFVYILISILAGPFLSLLAENVIFTEGLSRSKTDSVGLMFRMFLLSLSKAVFFLLIAGVSFILWFFPPMNIVGSFLVLLTIAFDCMDYTFEVEMMSLGQRAQFFRRHFWLFSGLAFAILATSFVPGVFFLLLPAFVAGAAKIYVDIQVKK